ncbi:MAG: DUF354 domain-containing protein [Bacteroidota bacterium]
MNIWFDFTNPPHVNFFKPLINYYKLKGFDSLCTAREFVETLDLLKLYQIDFQVYGKHGGRKKFNKILALLRRYQQLYHHIDSFDISFSSNNEAPLVSWLKRKPAFVFDDNDISPNWLYSKFSSWVISPEHIDKNAMYKMGVDPSRLLCYNGFKEHIYIADYEPDTSFLDGLPFDEFVTVRPENIQAAYIPKGVSSIVPALVEKLLSKKFNILFLPRYKSDYELIPADDRVFIPSKPLNGLDVSYYSTAILTGAGSFSREAAIMGTPAVSFYAGSKILGVDQKMFNDGLVYHSRNPEDIIKYLMTSKKKIFNQYNCKSVQANLFSLLDGKLNN